MQGTIMQASDLLGSWTLVHVEPLGPQAPGAPPPFGGQPRGVLHYLADGRMAVMIEVAGRKRVEGGRHGGTDAEWRRAAKSFTAYAGTYELAPGQVIHHVDFNSYPNDVGTDYVRTARIEGERLTLETPLDLPPDQRAMRLVWQRLESAG